MIRHINIFVIPICLFVACQSEKEPESAMTENKIRVIFDTDANNELDDQHALAYLLFNGDVFDVEGITVNSTRYGGGIDGHYAEAERILKLCNLNNKIPLLKGANSDFPSIRRHVGNADYDGSEAVDFILERAGEKADKKLILLMVGKLTNAALAILKKPEIIPDIEILWLGSNYPEPGEYNQDNDTAAMSFLLESDVELEIALVRYGQGTGTDAVRATQQEIGNNMPGKGPESMEPVEGRHGNVFSHFGDYSVNLFEHIDYHGDPPSRALFDMAAVAILKNPQWAIASSIPCPKLIGNKWVERPDNERKIIIWERFNRNAIMQDFYAVMENYTLVGEKMIKVKAEAEAKAKGSNRTGE